MLHTALGHIDIEIKPAIAHAQNKSNGVYAKSPGSIEYEVIPYDELLEVAVVEARARGANGISNLSISQDDSIYHVQGLLIRIE